MCHKITLAFLGFLITGLSLAAGSIIIIAYREFFNFKFEFLENLALNWSQAPSTSLSNSCSSLDTESFITDPFPGTVTGCLCDSKYTAMVEDVCPFNSCAQLAPFVNLKYTKYDNSPFCKQKQSTKNYLDLDVQLVTCTSGKKSCGVADTLGQLLCYSSTETCPINDVKIVGSLANVPTGYSYTTLSTKKVIYTNNNTSGNVLVQARISEGYPCALYTESNNGITQSFILDRYYNSKQCVTKVNNQLNDENFSKLDSTDYQSLVNSNLISGQITNLIKGYTFPPATISLFTKNYIGMKASCKSNFLNAIENNTVGFLTKLNNYNTFQQETKTLLYQNYITGIIYIILVTTHGIVTIFKGWYDYPITGRSRRNFIISIIESMSLSIALLILSGILLNKLSTFGNAPQTLIGCLDPIADGNLNIYANLFEELKKRATVCVACAAVTLFLIILEMVIWLVYENNVTRAQEVFLDIIKDKMKDLEREMEEARHHNRAEQEQQYANNQLAQNNGQVNTIGVEVTVNEDGSPLAADPAHEKENDQANTMGAFSQEIPKSKTTYDEENQELPPPNSAGEINNEGNVQSNANANADFQASGNLNVNVNIGNNDGQQGTVQASLNIGINTR